MASTTTWGEGSDKSGYDISQWYDSKPVKIGWLAILGVGAGSCISGRSGTRTG